MQISLSKIMLSTAAMALVFSGWSVGGAIPTLCMAAFVLAITLRWGLLAVVSMFAALTTVATLSREEQPLAALWIFCSSFFLSIFFATVNRIEQRSVKEWVRTDSKNAVESNHPDHRQPPDDESPGEPWQS